MPTVFVHGVTVRKDRYESLLVTVRKGLLDVQNDLTVEGFFWGDVASALRFGGASIPGFMAGVRAIEMPADERAQLMVLLLDDPYLELRILKDAEEFNPAGAGFAPMPRDVEHRNQAISGNQAALSSALNANPSLQAAIGKRLDSRTISQIVATALDHAGRTDRQLTVVDLLDPLSRCLTAALFQTAVGATPVIDTEFDWRQVEADVQKTLEDIFGGQRGWIGDKLKNAALSSVTFAMRHGVRRRLMESMSLFIGDVLVYLSKRAEILDNLESVVAKTTKTSDTPLWLIGHSLGGIISFDYCCQTARDVERLVTVGSQVGLFGELGALKAPLNANENKLETPAQVKRWINVYDPNDMLSFVAKPIFTRVNDIEFDTKAPFPVSHSEYWNRSEVYPELFK